MLSYDNISYHLSRLSHHDSRYRSTERTIKPFLHLANYICKFADIMVLGMVPAATAVFAL
jgi:hypothetical protein